MIRPKAPQETPAGKIDLHSHLLPGVDDGCETREDSLACVRRLMEQGFVGTVCTPHIIRDQFPGNTPEQVREWVADLQEYLRSAGVEYTLWVGGEVRIARGILPWFDAIGVPTLGNSRYVLLDWWEAAWPDYGFGLMRDLFQGGYQPVLAHPERMGLSNGDLLKLVAELQEMGVLLQGNFNSLSGGEGDRAAQMARRWLERGTYDLLATDMHRPHMLEGRIRGLAVAESLIGTESFRERMELRPREILGESLRSSHAA